MIDPVAPEGQKPLIRSLTLKGAVAMALAFAAAKAGVHLPDGVPEGLASALFDLMFYAGLVAVGVGRARAKGPLR